MNADLAVEVVRQVFFTTLTVGGPILAVGFVVGVLVSLVQIVTSMQDPAFNTVPRLLMFQGAIVVLLPWMIERLVTYTQGLFGGLERFAS